MTLPYSEKVSSHFVLFLNLFWFHPFFPISPSSKGGIRRRCSVFGITFQSDWLLICQYYSHSPQCICNFQISHLEASTPEKKKIAVGRIQKVAGVLRFRPANLVAFVSSVFCDRSKEHPLMALTPPACALQPSDKLGGCFSVLCFTGFCPISLKQSYKSLMRIFLFLS